MRITRQIAALISTACFSSGVFATGALGTPVDGSTVSGVGVISGYHCSSKNIEVFIDGVSMGPAGAGTRLLGTQDVCGRTDTGYSLLYNFNNLANGQHTISVAADGVVFGTNTVTTFKSGGVNWLSGASESLKIYDFPTSGEMATIDWVQSYQNFLITKIESTALDLSSLNGTYSQNIRVSTTGSSCSSYNLLSGDAHVFITTATASSANTKDSTLVYALTDYDICVFILSRTSGDSSSGYNLTGESVCASSLDTANPITATGVKKAANNKFLLGTVTRTLPGCSQKTQLLE
jgi:hypothetical protein